tara:strand:+ start:8553 stop:9026 length:474 start_codon:yes stop_codon:yes gene_type:complete
MDKNQVHKIASHVAASYVSRELDRVWLDRLMTTTVGKKLRALSTKEQKSFELLAYLSSAYVVNREPNPSALRSFLNTILSDIPPELAKRMMSQEEPPDSETALFLLEHIKDDELQNLGAIPVTEQQVAPEHSLAAKLLVKVENTRTNIRKNRYIIGR